jgi:hypothetical protein
MKRGGKKKTGTLDACLSILVLTCLKIFVMASIFVDKDMSLFLHPQDFARKTGKSFFIAHQS